MNADRLRSREASLRSRLIAFALLVFAAPSMALAGQACEQHPLTVQGIEHSLDLATKTMQALDGSGADVVLLAREGQDLSDYRLRYSHVGWAYKYAGEWRVVHKLNRCGTAVSSIYIQGLGEFFLDDLYRYEAGYVVPIPDVQRKLLALFTQRERLTSLHTRAYSMVAYPWATRYQQSNQWALETMAMAIDPDVTSRDTAQAWMRSKGYRPTTLKIGPLKRLGARAARANVAFDDHPSEKRFSDRIETVTADSIFRWLKESGLGGSVLTLP